MNAGMLHTLSGTLWHVNCSCAIVFLSVCFVSHVTERLVYAMNCAEVTCCIQCDKLSPSLHLSWNRPTPQPFLLGREPGHFAAWLHSGVLLCVSCARAAPSSKHKWSDICHVLCALLLQSAARIQSEDPASVEAFELETPAVKTVEVDALLTDKDIAVRVMAGQPCSCTSAANSLGQP
jgi:hypothetical protein